MRRMGVPGFPYHTNDPWGNTVELSFDVWYHIAVDRGRRAITIDAILAVVQNPRAITQDKVHQNRRCFYQMTTALSFRSAAYLKVVIDYASSPAVIVTAYPTNRIPSGEKVLWIRN
jgi:hypothetical protein